MLSAGQNWCGSEQIKLHIHNEEIMFIVIRLKITVLQRTSWFGMQVGRTSLMIRTQHAPLNTSLALEVSIDAVGTKL